MDSIYLNNFRGITNTTIPICKVNFFLGENSTGKSSVLSALALLSSPDFWFNLNFNTGDYEFGGYKDIVSISSQDKKEFQLGLFKGGDDPGKSACYVMHFQEDKNGLPVLARFSQLSTENFVTLKITPKEIAVYGSKNVPDCVKCFELGGCFEFLKNLPNNIKKGYKKIGGDFKVALKHSPILIFPAVLETLYPEYKTKKNDDLYPFPTLTDRRLASLAPIRTKPRRTYDGFTQRYSPEGEHTPYIIRANIGKKGGSSFRTALDSFGKESGLFSTVGVAQFGKDSSAPFELIINLSSNTPLRINSVGYGVSQALPVVVELLNRPDKTWFTVQQPEVHLHPRAQAALGDVFYQVASTQGKVLFVETHSDYLIDRFRLNYKNNKVDDNFCQILFFERGENGNKISQIKIQPDGEYPENQPKGFRSFFLEEQRKMLGF
ncbi:AAA family ATPase [Desulfuromonas thiophila]|uniref:AAA family ATPase n=1 Tax=Desulfuromonas thiophila TaxID=57664 RepID=UPI0029F4BB22|nr:AAA family ATPase [Desulfuromonas thiophila]